MEQDLPALLATLRGMPSMGIPAITLADPPPVTAIVEVSVDIGCAGDLSGEATVIPNGGVGGYTYLWDDGQPTATATVLPSGVHSVEITDANGCTDLVTVLMQDPPTLVCTAIAKDVSCAPGNTNGGSDLDGAISVVFSGGTPDPALEAEFGPGAGYLISITDIDGTPIGSTFTAAPGSTVTFDEESMGFGLDEGEYVALVQDGNGCLCIDQLSIERPEPIEVLGCASNSTAGSSGSILPVWYNTHQFTVSGGTPPYELDIERTGYVRWTIEQESDGASISIVYAGDAEWCVSLVDGNGCTIDLSSFDCCNDDGQGDSSIEGANGDLLNINAVEIQGENGSDANGSIDITIAGCTAGPPTYQWSGPGSFTATTEDISDLESGHYSVIVSCDNETTAGSYYVPLDRRTGRLKVGEDTPLAINAFPNPFQSSTRIEFSVEHEGQATVQLFTIDGSFISEIHSQQAEQGTVYYVELKGDALPAGVYMTLVKDAQGNQETNKLLLLK